MSNKQAFEGDGGKMKKFLIYLGAIISTVAVGFTVFYIVRSDETLSISLDEVYVNTGDEFSIDLNHENAKAYTSVEVVLAGGENDTTVMLLSEEDDVYTFKAGTAGLTQITFRTDNENFRNLSCKVYVGDGSSEYPFYITTAAQLERIGTQSEQDKGYGGYSLSSCYKLINNINLKNGTKATGCWVPIGTNVFDEEENPLHFTGSFNGNGKTISGVRINAAEYNEIQSNIEGGVPISLSNVGLFSVIGNGGLIYGLKVDNVSIIGNYTTVGSVAGINKGGILESIKVTNAIFDVGDSAYVGGIAGKNISTYINESSETSTEYSRYIARIDRCSFSGVFGTETRDVATTEEGVTTTETVYDICRLSGTVGGLTAQNNAGIVIYSYAQGTVYLSGSNVVFGGIVGINQDADLHNAGENSTYRYPSNIVGAHIKNCYSTLSLYVAQITSIDVSSRIGGIVGYNISSTKTVIIIDDIQFAVTANVSALGGNAETEEIDNNKIIGNYYRVEDASYANRLFIKDKTKTELPNNSFYGVAQQGTSLETVSPIITVLRSKDEYSDYPISSLGEKEILYKAAMKYVAVSKTDTEMKTQATYVSHTGNEAGTIFVTWKFDICWTISPSSNGGYPELVYSVISITDDLDDVYDGVIYNPYDLAEMTLTGNYYIVRDIDMAYYLDTETSVLKLWTPIGTADSPFVGTLRAGAKEWDEEGNPTAYYTISNLRISTVANINAAVEVENVVANTYAGLFGVIGATGKVVDVHILNSSFAATKGSNSSSEDADANNAYVGAIAGINYGSIIRPYIAGCVVQGASYVGGIAGFNKGSIESAVVTDIKNDQNEITAGTKIICNAINGTAYIGGISGANYKRAAISSSILDRLISVTEGEVTTISIQKELYRVQVIGSVLISATGLDGITSTVCMGGVVGQNRGSIYNADVYLTKEISAAQELDGYLGGIAGSCIKKAYIEGCYVQATIDSQATTYTTEEGIDRTPTTYVGGLVGTMVDYSRIVLSASYSSFLSGRFVGGLVAKVSVPTTYSMESTISTAVNWTGERKTAPNVDGVVACIDQCFAEGLSIYAYKAGSLVYILDNGLITNCYVESPDGAISSDIEGAVLAGFAVEINFGSSNKSTSQGGVIAYSYVAIRIKATNGTAYAETSSYIKKPTQYNAGYLLSYVHDAEVLNKDVSTDAIIQTSGWGFGETAGKAVGKFFVSTADTVAGWFGGDIENTKYEYYQGISTGSMKSGVSNPKIDECNFDIDIWSFYSGSYGYLNNVSIPGAWTYVPVVQDDGE